MEFPTFSSALPILHQAGFLTRLIPASEENPTEQLLVVMDDEDSTDLKRLELTFLSGLEDPFVLQLFMGLPCSIQETYKVDLSRFILAVNNHVPLTGFGLKEPEMWVYFRHLMPVNSQGLDGELLAQTIWLIWYVVDRFSGIVKEVAEGNKNLEAGLQALEENLQHWQPTNE
ncbi:MAG: YbjN domain-containing protein [Oscillatoria princeps RMCB-10]|jgi:hypothetical protein|nr:YbjN domain-containing protein [Oscillatoria princeps RMCB-10]